MSKSIAHLILKDILEIRNTLGRLPTEGQYFNKLGKFPRETVNHEFGSWIAFYTSAATKEPPEEPREPKILILDIETAPILAYVWGLGENFVPLEHVVKEGHLLSFAAQWLDSEEMIYFDQRKEKDISNDKKMCEKIWNLFDEADIVAGQYSKHFDVPYILGRMAIHKLQPPKKFHQRDLKDITKKLRLLSTKLAYVSKKFNRNHIKSKHGKFPGIELWREVLNGNKEAWAEMEEYNKQDVLSTKESYKELEGWGFPGISVNVFSGSTTFGCPNGHKDYKRDGHQYMSTGKFQRFRCNVCRAVFYETGTSRNLMSNLKKDSLKGA